jgi:hypothetical protein
MKSGEIRTDQNKSGEIKLTTSKFRPGRTYSGRPFRGRAWASSRGGDGAHRRKQHGGQGPIWAAEQRASSRRVETWAETRRAGGSGGDEADGRGRGRRPGRDEAGRSIRSAAEHDAIPIGRTTGDSISSIQRRTRVSDEAGTVGDRRGDGGGWEEARGGGGSGRTRRRRAGAGGGCGNEKKELTYGSDTMLGIDKLYSLGAKGHNI